MRTACNLKESEKNCRDIEIFPVGPFICLEVNNSSHNTTLKMYALIRQPWAQFVQAQPFLGFDIDKLEQAEAELSQDRPQVRLRLRLEGLPQQIVICLVLINSSHIITLHRYDMILQAQQYLGLR